MKIQVKKHPQIMTASINVKSYPRRSRTLMPRPPAPADCPMSLLTVLAFGSPLQVLRSVLSMRSAAVASWSSGICSFGEMAGLVIMGRFVAEGCCCFDVRFGDAFSRGEDRLEAMLREGGSVYGYGKPLCSGETEADIGRGSMDDVRGGSRWIVCEDDDGKVGSWYC
jgi:hypothetical protein